MALAPSARVFLAGHRGMLGSAFARRFEAEGFTQVLTRGREELDLRDQAAVEAFFEAERPEVVVLAAGVVGGILRNRDFPADLIEDNLALQLDVLRAARRHGAELVWFFGSSCMYPRECPQPMAETALGTGPMEPTSLPYSTAKHAGLQLCLAYDRQDGAARFLPVIPNTMFGPGDDFDLETGHFLPALIRRFHEAKERGAAAVTLWGTGSPRRELVYVDDVVDACMHLAGQPAGELEFPMNIGTGTDRSIAEVADLVRDVVGFAGRVEWDTSKPDGAPRKLLDSARLRATGWEPRVGLEDGIRRTYTWYLEHEGKRT